MNGVVELECVFGEPPPVSPPLVSPPALQLADVLQVGRPVQAAGAILQPALELTPVYLQEVCQHHAAKHLTATHDLVEGWAGAHVHKHLPPHVTLETDER